MAMVAQGRLGEAEPSLEQAERILRAEVEPAAGMRLHYARGLFEFVSGRPGAALGPFRTAERLAGVLVTQHTLARRLRSHVLQTLVRLGETQRAEETLAAMDGAERDSGEMRNAMAALRLAQDDPNAATVALAPVIDGSVPLLNAHLWDVQAFLLEAIARDALGDAGGARRALERALELAQPEGLVFPFLFDPAPGLLERHRRQGTAHGTLISEILNVLAGRKPAAPPGQEGGRGLREPLSHSEIRVLRYLPTKLSAPEIADQLYLSVNTVKTHMRHVYDKLGVHRRHEAVEQARALGLLASSPRRA
jgi:LuxR family maltose regulon positive regulatory protein